ncbi:putative WRKY transcription factor [Quillaja saponaria]|uniref:WRKY transcription factor n=1 Tax=Quillaja saponaria TaxID=32244 RepID=A0AAD7PS73_QUISA|nr:putative WRKY transcription factor [Quillaja saponaria]
MEETNGLVLQGCKLARDLESNLPNLSNQPNILSNYLDEILKIFGTAKERLHLSVSQVQNSSLSNMLMLHQKGEGHLIGESSVQEWLIRSTCRQPMEMVQLQMQDESKMVGGNYMEFHELRSGTAPNPGVDELGGRDAEGLMHLNVKGQAIDASSSQRPRRGKDAEAEEKRNIMVPAPLFGNTELPPEDGFTWRKYGQKEILGSKFPRSYYRCTHQKLYQCSAKKQVQRLDNDPSIFGVTYRGKHTCLMSSTAPSSSSVPPLVATHTVTTPPPISSSTTALGWLSTDLSLHDAGGAAAGPSTSTTTTTRYGGGREVDHLYPAVADMADAMFNISCSSSSNSMEFLFPSSSMEDKWEQQGDKNN